MNAELWKDAYFQGYIGDGTEKETPVRRGRARKAVLGFFCAFSVLTYSAGAFALAEKVTSADHLISAISAVLEEDKAVLALPRQEISVKVEHTVSEEVPNEDLGAKDDAGIHAIEKADLSCDSVLDLANQTDYKPDMKELSAKAASAVPKIDGFVAGPLVLVVHTHATETYTPAGEDTYTDETGFRTSDPSRNMIAVGNKVCEGLEMAGIDAIHCTEMFDEESYVDSYGKCAAEISWYLDEYPSIRYVLDVHRDAIFRQDMTLVAPVTEDGAAQVMLVCGTDEMGADFPDWRENLSFALAVQSAAEEKHPGFMRNINLRGASFNQQLAKRFLLVEVGSAGNTLEEALEAGYRFGEVFGGVIGG